MNKEDLNQMVKFSKIILMLDSQIEGVQKIAEELIDGEEYTLNFSMEKLMKVEAVPAPQAVFYTEVNGQPMLLPSDMGGMDILSMFTGKKAAKPAIPFKLSSNTALVILQVIVASYQKAKNEIEAKMLQLATKVV